MPAACQETIPGAVLRGTRRPLAHHYRTALVDLDGVVYRGTVAISHAAEALAGVRRHGIRTLFITNNASRTPDEVASLLGGLGVAAGELDVVTSAQAAAGMAAARVPAGSPVLVVGGAAMERAVTERGLRPVRSADDRPAAVVQGFAPDVDWRQLAEAAYAVATGVPWIVSNMDLAVPRERGIAPGNGALANAVGAAAGKQPIIAGKPGEAIYADAQRRAPGPHLIVGDSLETDIEGAHRAGLDSLLVLTGMTTVSGLLAAPVRHRPTYLAGDLRELLRPHTPTYREGDCWTCGRWAALRRGDGIVLRAPADDCRGPAVSDLTDAARALCHAAWALAGDGVSAEPGLRCWQDRWERSLADAGGPATR
jgi:HAD superfamily hydrolase (TIGR01450 family)